MACSTGQVQQQHVAGGPLDHVADGMLTVRERKPWWSAGSAKSWSLSLANIRSYSGDWVKRP